jgi:hypothetical protein
VLSFGLYFDEDSVIRALTAALRLHGIDVTTAVEAGNLGRTDEEHLYYSTEQHRVLFTFNRGHFHDLHSRWLAEGKSHAGIILAPQQRYSVGEYMRRLLHMQALRSSEEMRDQVEFLGAWG